jgi:hypothetical protein
MPVAGSRRPEGKIVLLESCDSTQEEERRAEQLTYIFCLLKMFSQIGPRSRHGDWNPRPAFG